jgi:hypothetical protein
MPLGAIVLRIAHTLVAVVEVWALGTVWDAALRRRRGVRVRLAVTLLLAQGAALAVGRGNCPLGPLQESCGDPVPLFELVLPPRAAKAAIPALFLVAVGGLVAAAARPPQALAGRRPQ